ncbi:T9SS type A sorting domain-containing protein [Neolewinella lacunae]|uniref:T9SS type A sorting domain-containing protein n=1 Tax=Neolewinella lacunae TaxID=1517758 RepID=A0A923T8M2_9BACT|nr:T9SS type A sorting domain-containing protein [Neolewinella lacunae]MBC6994691.1 T9SS type A sorting domain-containing protein [Neolewinella lacunae]MDN3634563.1 T9SS type A sorting domain-containing protein [Neolewinella lacunae]
MPSYRTIISGLCLVMGFLSANLRAQDSIVVTLPFYFEDAQGNRDTVTIIISDHKSDSINAALRSSNILGEPYDSVLEVRASEYDQFIFGDPARYEYKRQVIRRVYLSGDPDECINYLFSEVIAFAINVKYPPLKVYWNQDAFARDGFSNCTHTSWIINSFIAETVYPWWTVENREGGIYWKCLALDSSIVYQSFDAMPGSNSHRAFSFTLQPVEGSSNPLDTIEVLSIYLSPPLFMPCSDLISSTSVTPPSVQPSVFPNPVSGLLHWPDGANASPVQVATVYAMNGQRLLMQQRVDSSLDVSQLPPGAYVLRLDYQNGRFSAHKFFKR